MRCLYCCPDNQTIDDGLGDSLTGFKVQYSPPADSHGLVWKSQDTCGDCAIIPNRTEAYNNTWNSATAMDSENVTAMFSFKGTAIYIYFIIPNLPGGARVTSIVDCDFLVDGRIAGNYIHARMVYVNTSLSDAPHTFTIQAKKDSIVIFDYAQYTTDTPVSSGIISAQPESSKSTNTVSITSAITTATASATSNTGAIGASAHSSTPADVIAGSVIGGVVGIALIVLGVILYRRHISLEGSSTTLAGKGSEMASGRTTPSTLREQAKLERQSSNLRVEQLLVEVKQLVTQQYLLNSGGLRQTETSGTREGPTTLPSTRASTMVRGEKMWVVADQPAGQHGGSGYSNAGAHAY
ncbi:hypothetical protein BD779DRAFT_1557218 [Infundibulicybe gibba]|nr:hypothetical protein BD779DRAFT_1557218 [Infundibulicybe gibba]